MITVAAKSTHEPLVRKVLQFVLFLVACICLVQVENFLRMLDRRETENNRAFLLSAAQRVVKAQTVDRILGIAVQPLFAEFKQVVVQARNELGLPLARLFDRKLRRVFGKRLRSVYFDRNGKVVLNNGFTASDEDASTLWRGMFATYLRNNALLPKAFEGWPEPGEAMASRIFSPFVGIDQAYRGSQFELKFADQQGKKHFVSSVRVGSYPAGLSPENIPYPGCMLILGQDDLPPGLARETLFSLLPKDLDCAAILTEDRMYRSPRDLSALPVPPVTSLSPDGSEVSAVDPCHWLCQPVRSQGFLLFLGQKRKMAWFSRFGPMLLLRILLLLLLWRGLLLLTSLAVNPDEIKVSLTWQILGAFLVSCLLQVTSLFFMGLESAMVAEKHAGEVWGRRMDRLMDIADRSLENNQMMFQFQAYRAGFRLAQSLEGGGTFSPKVLENSLPYSWNPAQQWNRTANAIFVYRKDRRIHTPETAKFNQQAAKKGIEKTMELVLEDVLVEILRVRKESDPQTSARDAKIRLTFKDIVGEDHYLLKILSRFGLVNNILVNDNNQFYMVDVIEDSFGKVLALGLFYFSHFYHSGEFFLRSFPEIASSPFVPMRLVAAHGSSEIPSLFKNTRIRMLGKILVESRDRVDEMVRLKGSDYRVRGRALRFNQEYGILTLLPQHFISLWIRRRSMILVLLLCFGSAVLFGSIFLLNRHILDPIREITEGARRIGAEDFDVRLPVVTRDELGELTHSMNLLAGGLRERERLRRFVSGDLWLRASSGNPAGERTWVALLFSDIRNFTSHSEAHPAPEVVAMLNDYFSEMDPVIRAEAGDIDKFIGDAIQAVFRQVSGGDHPVRRAIRAGLGMREALGVLNARRRQHGAFTIDNGIGIAWGEVVSGGIGGCGGSGGRRDFTVMGPPLAQANALEALSKVGRFSRVIVGPQALEFLSDHWEVVELSGPDGIKGFEITGKPVG